MEWLKRLFGPRRRPGSAETPVKVTGFPEGPFRPEQVHDDDIYMRLMVAACMNADGVVNGEIDDAGTLHIKADGDTDERTARKHID